MSLISVTDVRVLNNPAPFTSSFQFEISFECLAPVKEELEWKLVYVGSAEDEQYDQELDSVLVGPINVGKNKFVFEAAAPDASLIPSKDLLEVTVLLLTCAYKEKEFIRIGYYVNNDFAPQEVAMIAERDAWRMRTLTLQSNYAAAVAEIQAQEEQLRTAGQFTEPLPLPPMPVLPPPPAVDVKFLHRNILADKPRVTRFQIPWDSPADATDNYTMSEADQAEAMKEAEAAQQPTGDATGENVPQVMADDGEEEEEDDEEDEAMDGEEDISDI